MRYGRNALLNISTGSMLHVNASQLTTSLNSLKLALLVLHVFMERVRRNEALYINL